MDSWTPVIGQTLLMKREPTNPKDKNAVALYEDDSIIGHVPYNLAPYLSTFFDKRRKQGVRRGDRRKSKQESWIWARDTLCVSSLWT